MQIKLIPDQQEAVASVIRVQTLGRLKHKQLFVILITIHSCQWPCCCMWLPSRAGVPALPVLQAQAKAAAFRSHVFPVRYAHEEVGLLDPLLPSTVISKTSGSRYAHAESACPKQVPLNQTVCFRVLQPANQVTSAELCASCLHGHTEARREAVFVLQDLLETDCVLEFRLLFQDLVKPRWGQQSLLLLSMRPRLWWAMQT